MRVILSGYIQICHFYRTLSRVLLFSWTQCIYRLRFSQNRYPVFFHGNAFFHAYAKLYNLSNIGVKVRVRKRLGFMSGLTLPALVDRGRHRKPTANHAECVQSSVEFQHVCRSTCRRAVFDRYHCVIIKKL